MHGDGGFARAALFVTDDDDMRHTAVPLPPAFVQGIVDATICGVCVFGKCGRHCNVPAIDQPSVSILETDTPVPSCCRIVPRNEHIARQSAPLNLIILKLEIIRLTLPVPENQTAENQ